MIKTALGQVGGSRPFQRTAAFKALDPTEKGAVSYFLGMAVCKLFASRVLDTPWLLHLDVFGNQLSAATKSGRSRPDLIGLNTSGAWHVFESKGRSGSPSAKDKLKAKQQVQRLVTVNGEESNLFVIHPANYSIVSQSPEPHYVRLLEPKVWENYLGSCKPFKINQKFIITQWGTKKFNHDMPVRVFAKLHKEFGRSVAIVYFFSILTVPIASGLFRLISTYFG
jgi:hypothetical protein